MTVPDDNQLGTYLRARRARLDPAAFGFSPARRRTPGLRREEVAQRANVSATWYTWLEQGRGGAPSTDVLDRLARALDLNQAEREHLFLLAQNRPPQADYQPPSAVTPQLQRLLDSLDTSPALVKTAAWDVIAWNRAARLLLTDYEALPVQNRNALRTIFCEPAVRTRLLDWEDVARNAVAAFRAETARAGASDRVVELVEELTARSPDFAAFWRAHDVKVPGQGVKRMLHPTAGRLTLEYSSFAVDGRPDLGLLIFTPAGDEDVRRIRDLLSA